MIRTPFTFLNLLLSTLAGLQGAILLIADKRQDEISAALAKHDFETNRTGETENRETQALARELHNKSRAGDYECILAFLVNAMVASLVIGVLAHIAD